jgi:hemolysin activation/secretion protein
MSNSTISFERWQKCGNDYNKANFRQARTGANYDFDWYEISGRHSQFLDPNKVHRVSGSVRWVGTQSRLVPAKMTSFGGLYSVRGYDEYEIVADGGLLTRLQYEYDLIAAEEASMTAEEKEQMGQREKDPYEIKRAAPLCFLDYGRTTINHPVAGLAERRHVHLMSVGIGALIEVGDNFSGAVYYGHPLRSTDKTREGKGRVNATFTLKW